MTTLCSIAQCVHDATFQYFTTYGIPTSHGPLLCFSAYTDLYHLYELASGALGIYTTVKHLPMQALEGVFVHV